MKLYAMITSHAATLGEWAAKRQALPHEFLDLEYFTPVPIIYGQHLGAYPIKTPLEVSNGWYSSHVYLTREDVRARLRGSSPEVACIDYENWPLLMDKDPHSPDPRAGIYEACAAAVVRTALAECSRLYPATRWGLYDWPGFVWGDTYSDDLRAYHDRTRYVIDSSGVFFPVFYVPSGRSDYLWIRKAVDNAIAECERLDPGKPIVPLITRKFADDPWVDMPVDLQEHQVSDVSRALRSRRHANDNDGIAVWASVNSVSDLESIQSHLAIVRRLA